MPQARLALIRERNECWYGAVPMPYFANSGDLVSSPPDLTADLQPRIGPASGATPWQLEARQALQEYLRLVATEAPDAVPQKTADAAPGDRRKKRKAIPKGQSAANVPVDPWSEEACLHRGMCKIIFEDPSRTLAEDMRAAWDRVAERDDAIWDELMEGLLREYHAVRPASLKWMKALYGDLPVERLLPVADTIADLKRLVRPQAIYVYHPDGQDVNVGVFTRCTWFRDPLGVVLRNGRFSHIGQGLSAIRSSMPDFSDRWLNHPSLGVLELHSESWRGQTRCEPFIDFFPLIDPYIDFWKDPASEKNLAPPVGWDLLHGVFDLWIVTRNGNKPSEQQVREYQRFRNGEQEYAQIVLNAIFEHYRKTFDQHRRNWKDTYPELHVPEVRSIDDLRPLMKLDRIYIYPESADGRVCMGFDVLPCWTYTADVCVLLQDGQFVEVGEWSAKEMERDAMLLAGD